MFQIVMGQPKINRFNLKDKWKKEQYVGDLFSSIYIFYYFWTEFVIYIKYLKLILTVIQLTLMQYSTISLTRVLLLNVSTSQKRPRCFVRVVPTLHTRTHDIFLSGQNTEAPRSSIGFSQFIFSLLLR